jgi:mRNA interferase MazF
MVIHRGEIWWADLREPTGSEPGFRRPVVILQSDDFNASRIQTVIAAVITSKTHLASAPGNVLLKSDDSGLPKDSVVNVSQIMTIDKAFLTEKCRKLPAKVISAIEIGLKLVMSFKISEFRLS